MMNKTKWLSGLAAVAVLGSAATPILASAHGADGSARSEQKVTPEGTAKPVRAGNPLATALGVEPAALEAAVKAAIEATPKPADKKDAAALEAYRVAFTAKIAASLGITVAQLETAVQSLKPVKSVKVEREDLHGKALAAALGITPDVLNVAVKDARAGVPALTSEQKKDAAARTAHNAAVEAAIAAKLGITLDAFNAAQAKVKADATSKKAEQSDERKAKAAAQFAEHLARLVTAGVLTQAQADEVRVQYNLGGDAQEQAMKRLKALIGEQKKDDKGEKAGAEFSQVLTRLVGAGVLTQAQATEMLAQYNLGGDAKEQAAKRLRTLLQEQKKDQANEKAAAQFSQVLTRLVGAGVLTQAQATEMLAQFNLGGDAQEQVAKRLRTLLQGEKTEKRDEKKSDKADAKKSALERAAKARSGKPS